MLLSNVVTITTSGVPGGIRTVLEEPPKSHNMNRTNVNPPTAYTASLLTSRGLLSDDERGGL